MPRLKSRVASTIPLAPNASSSKSRESQGRSTSHLEQRYSRNNNGRVAVYFVACDQQRNIFVSCISSCTVQCRSSDQHGPNHARRPTHDNVSHTSKIRRKIKPAVPLELQKLISPTFSVPSFSSGPPLLSGQRGWHIWPFILRHTAPLRSFGKRACWCLEVKLGGGTPSLHASRFTDTNDKFKVTVGSCRAGSPPSFSSNLTSRANERADRAGRAIFRGLW